MPQSITPRLMFGFVLATILLLGVGAVSLANTVRLGDTEGWVTHTHAVLAQLNSILASVTDAEASQRGYLITADPRYLAPYDQARATVGGELTDLQQLTVDDATQQARVVELRAAISTRLQVLADTLAIRQRAGFDAAREAVMTDRGKQAMDHIRSVFDAMTNEEQALLAARTDASAAQARIALAAVAALIVLELLLLSGVFLAVQNYLRLRRGAESALRASEALMRDLATHDSLTGLLNRREIDRLLDQECARATRYGHTLALLLLDLDHFKAVNDTYGHPAGDAALQEVAAAVRRVVRASDWAARFGGEEFALLAPETEERAALQLAERLRATIAAQPLPATGTALTVSLGVALFPADATTPDGLVAAADRALYAAKQDGRNRTIAAGGPPSAEAAPA